MLHCGDGVAARREKERGITKDDMEKDSEKRSTDRKGRPAGPKRGEGGSQGWLGSKSQLGARGCNPTRRIG